VRSEALVLLIAAVAIVFMVARAVAIRCRNRPKRRRWYITAAIAALILTALLTPWVFAKLTPPFSESPAGVFVILGKVLIAGSVGLVGLGSLIGALLPGAVVFRKPNQ